MIISHTNSAYIAKWHAARLNRFNGAYYYSKEIAETMIPLVDTDRSWITVNVPGLGCDHAIVFVHNNLHPERYEWLRRYKDIVLVCGIPETVEKVAHIGKAIYLPLSIDVEYVKQFKIKKSDKTKGAAFVGRPVKKKYGKLPGGIDYLEGLERDKLLQRMAEYKEVYAVGRCALEAKVLGCRLKPYDDRFPNVSRWKVLDTREAAKILQERLDEIDGQGVREEVLQQQDVADLSE